MRKPARISGIVSFLAASVAAACAETYDGPDAADVTLRDSAGTTIVVNHEPAWAEGDAWTVSTEPTLRIGAVESEDPAEHFTSVGDVTRLSDGRIVVLERETSEVRWFGPDGRHLVTVGGRGGGPGEFNSASQLLRLPGDTILVVDQPRVEHVLFTPDGEFVRQETLDDERDRALGSWRECLSQTLPDRSLLRCQTDPSLPQRPEGPDPGPGHLRYFLRYVRLPFDLEDVDTLGVYGSLEQWGVPYEDRTVFAIHPFHARTVTAAGGRPLRIAIAVNPEYSIEVWTPEGGLERIVRRPGGARAPTEEVDSLVRERFEVFARGDARLLERLLDEIPTPERIPAVGTMVFGSEGELWVRWAAAPSDRGRVYDVFDREGRWLGQVAAPPVGVQEIGTDYLLGVRYDELRIPYVEMYALDRGGG